MSSKQRIKQVIAEVYSTYPLSPDRIVCDPQASQEFAKRVNANLPAEQRQDAVRINKLLLNLRKLGEDRGGLKRRWRT